MFILFCFVLSSSSLFFNVFIHTWVYCSRPTKLNNPQRHWPFCVFFNHWKFNENVENPKLLFYRCWYSKIFALGILINLVPLTIDCDCAGNICANTVASTKVTKTNGVTKTITTIVILIFQNTSMRYQNDLFFCIFLLILRDVTQWMLKHFSIFDSMHWCKRSKNSIASIFTQ